MGRDKYGNYVNEKGVTIKINEDKKGNDHISFYDGPVDGDHSAVHININYGNSSYSTETHNEDKTESDNASGGCYLTTACMKNYLEEFDDNCYELNLLRWFRDNFVSKDDIDHYYRVAPNIVKYIEGLPNSNAVYRDIYQNIIKVCVKAIEDKDYDFVYRIYKNHVLSLEKEYEISIMV